MFMERCLKQKHDAHSPGTTKLVKVELSHARNVMHMATRKRLYDQNKPREFICSPSLAVCESYLRRISVWTFVSQTWYNF
ncbi:hypothetical protein QR680_000533 [Steinernema hermaphroditum]|uniref:Uncharacterized protein n=1 Tax=Steinernema hermaphroditum TaxID=289476 RepID=A0AA39LE80_9BILA|nr:hypothetical protein QR680_000533 [Steinernema hermaphroditum]